MITGYINVYCGVQKSMNFSPDRHSHTKRVLYGVFFIFFIYNAPTTLLHGYFRFWISWHDGTASLEQTRHYQIMFWSKLLYIEKIIFLKNHVFIDFNKYKVYRSVLSSDSSIWHIPNLSVTSNLTANRLFIVYSKIFGILSKI